jgi:hypothetical protein
MGIQPDWNKEVQSAAGSSRGRGRLRALICVGLVAVAAQAFAPSAHAGPIVSSAASCDNQVFEQPFLPWADPANYVLAPSGTFEQDLDRWILSRGASVVSGNEPFFVHASGESASLSLAPGSSATSASMCVGIEHPTLRLFARNRGSVLSPLNVEVLYEDAGGHPHALTIGALIGKSQWRPSIPMPIVVNLLPLLPGERTAVAFRFSTGVAGGSWQIDDVYVDPYRSR